MTSVMSSLATTAGYEDTAGPNVTANPSPRCIDQPGCVAQLLIHATIFLLGVVGNGLVVWVIGFKAKQKKTVTTRWYLSLAVSDLLYCATLPFYIHQVATGSWAFGRFMCKFGYFFVFLNMFSSVFLMVLISGDRCVGVTFPIWARNKRTLRRARLAVVVAWILAAVMSVPCLVARDVTTDHDKQVTACYNSYEMLAGSSAFIVTRFVLGFLLPLLVITVCYSVIVARLRSNRTARHTRPLKVMTAVIVTFILCWLPYHLFHLAAINYSNYNYKFIAGQISVVLVSVSSCVNPFLYAFMGKDAKQKLLSSLFSRIENAVNEENKESVSTDVVEAPIGHDNEILSQSND